MAGEWLRKVQLATVEILDEFVRVCNENGLTYYLDGGTLLGAIRHDGFIPWDDDIDVAMPRADYDRFMEIAGDKLKPGYHLEAWKYEAVDPYYHMRIRKLGTVYENWQSRRFGLKSTGIWLDIFPLDAQIDIRSPRRRLDYIELKALKRILFIYNWKAANRSLKSRIFIGFLHILPFNAYRRYRDHVVRRHQGKNTEYIASTVSPYGLANQTFRKEWYEPSAMHVFESGVYRVPGEYDRVLRTIYGDYMKLPPEEQRKCHTPTRLTFDVNGPDEVL